MDRDYAMKAQAALSAQQYTAGSSPINTPVQSMSEGIISRLNYIRSNLSEHRASLNAAADKIVGYAPTPIAPGNGSGQIVKERPPASCFLDALSQVVADIELIGAEVQEHLNRLHRAF